MSFSLEVVFNLCTMICFLCYKVSVSVYNSRAPDSSLTPALFLEYLLNFTIDKDILCIVFMCIPTLMLEQL